MNAQNSKYKPWSTSLDSQRITTLAVLIVLTVFASISKVSAADPFQVTCESTDLFGDRFFVTVTVKNVSKDYYFENVISLKKQSGTGYIVGAEKPRVHSIAPGETVKYTFELRGSRDYRCQAWVHWNQGFSLGGDNKIAKWILDDCDDLRDRIKRYNELLPRNENAAFYNAEADILRTRQESSRRMWMNSSPATQTDQSAQG